MLYAFFAHTTHVESPLERKLNCRPISLSRRRRPRRGVSLATTAPPPASLLRRLICVVWTALLIGPVCSLGWWAPIERPGPFRGARTRVRWLDRRGPGRAGARGSSCLAPLAQGDTGRSKRPISIRSRASTCGPNNYVGFRKIRWSRASIERSREPLAFPPLRAQKIRPAGVLPAASLPECV